MNITVDEFGMEKSQLVNQLDSQNSSENLLFIPRQKQASDINHIKKNLENHFIFYNLSTQELYNIFN
jgi:hypothetical protein